MDKRIIIGLGTGRCGTKTLATLYGKMGINSTHEDVCLPWNFNKGVIDTMMNRLLNRRGDIVADVAFYYLPYVEYLIKQIDSITFVAMKRNMKSTTSSYLNHTHGRNHWCDEGDHLRDPVWDVCYPKYPLMDKVKAVNRYWREYYKEVKRLETKYPNHVKLFDFYRVLNTKHGQDQMLRFAGLSDKENHLAIVMNKSKR
jgi:hypothetical protein